MPMTPIDRNRGEGSTSLKVTNKGKSHLNGRVSPSDLPRKKRVPGACDVCKRRKIRCDSSEMPGNKCSNCIQFGHDCTHREATKHLGPAKEYVESLERKLERMEKLLNKVMPGVDLNQDDDIEPPPPVSMPRNDIDTLPLSEQFAKFQINPPQSRFFGRSSTFHLVQTALDMKGEFTGSPTDITKRILGSRRHETWSGPARFRTISLERPTPEYTFPEPDLLKSLVDLYFDEISIFFPILHRPTFEASVAEGLHLKDRHFGAVVLLVCALGAKFSDDPRVFSDISLLDGQDMSDEEKTRALIASGGWKWFEQVNLIRANLAERPTLCELQAHALSVLFGHSSEEPHGVWTQMGIAMRMAQDVGAHRKCTKYESRAQDELWRRTFWIITCHDRTMSAFSGKPICLQAEDIDVDFPTECDDEYWDHPDPEQRFKQPAGKPSVMAFFTCYLSLSDILAWAVKAIYSVSKPHRCRYANSMRYSEQQSLADLDSAMNSWMGSLPDHLRWNPNEPNSTFLAQSATLHAMYYQLQIFIHRPFIPSPRNPTPSVYPSLAICTNAARSCCHVLETQSKRDLRSYKLSLMAMPTFTSAVVLLLNIWSSKRSGVNMYPRREYEDVQKCLDMLKKCEVRKPLAGRLWEILKDLSSVGEPNDDGQSSPTKKGPEGELRSQESSPACLRVSKNSALSQAAQAPSSLVSSPGAAQEPPRLVVSPSSETNAQSPPHYMLPFYSNELGRLPVFGQFSFSDPPASNTPITQPDFFQRPQSSAPSQFIIGDNEGLGSLDSNLGSPISSVFSSSTASTPSTRVSTASLPIGSLPHPITKQPVPNTQAAAGGNLSNAQNNQQDIFSFGDLYPLQASTQVPSTSVLTPEDASAAVQLMAQFSSLSEANNSSVAGSATLGSVPCGGGASQHVLCQATQPQRDLLYDTNQMMVDEQMLTMWSTAPYGFELDDWGTYISSVDQIMRDQSMM